jgi:hypothetical protein
MKNLGLLLLSIWLILTRLGNLLGVNYRYRGLNVLMDVLALAAGVLILWALMTDKATAA